MLAPGGISHILLMNIVQRDKLEFGGIMKVIENFGLIMFCAMIPLVIGVIVAVLNNEKKK